MDVGVRPGYQDPEDLEDQAFPVLHRVDDRRVRLLAGEPLRARDPRGWGGRVLRRSRPDRGGQLGQGRLRVADVDLFYNTIK